MTRKVSSDDFVFTLDGQDYHPHAGKSVTLRRKISSTGLCTTLRFAALAGKGVKATEESATEFTTALMDTAKVLAENVLEWDWEDEFGKPYPQPYKRPEVLADLHVQELMWLIGNYHEPATSMPKNSSTAS
jgi:hypothetical protein